MQACTVLLHLLGACPLHEKPYMETNDVNLSVCLCLHMQLCCQLPSSGRVETGSRSTGWLAKAGSMHPALS